jgi:two-component system LytT family response regulator
MIRNVVIEDEPDQLEGMLKLLGKYCPEVEVVATAGDKSSAIEVILTWHPDLVFLDIQLMGATTAGFEVLEAVHFIDFELVFLSSHTEFALQAVTLQRQVCYFLEKPVQIDRTILAVNKAAQMIQLKTTVNAPVVFHERLAVPARNGLELLWIKKIMHCEADTWMTKVFLTDRSKMLPVSKNLGWFAQQLPVDKFVRVHNSHLVNLDFVVAYTTMEGGSLILTSGIKIPVGPSFREDLLRKVHQL